MAKKTPGDLLFDDLQDAAWRFAKDVHARLCPAGGYECEVHRSDSTMSLIATEYMSTAAIVFTTHANRLSDEKMPVIQA